MKKILGFLLAAAVFAQANLDITGAQRIYPIAVPDFCLKDGEASAGKTIQKTILRDLELSGLFRLVSPSTYIEQPGKCLENNNLQYSDWSVIGVDGVVKGEISGSGDSITARLYLFDVGVQQLKLAKEYSGSTNRSDLIAHKFANEIIRLFTGFPGVFGTQVAFSQRTGRFKELALTEFGGDKIYPLTTDNSISLSAAWDKNAENLLFSTYRIRVPDLFIYNMADKKSYRVTSAPEVEVGGQFLADGNIITAITNGGESDLVKMTKGGKILSRLTPGGGVIDVSPSLSPDQSQFIFTSNRSGAPQIYLMSTSGGSASRISRVNSSYCTSPSWSPKGDKIAFVCRVGGQNQLFMAAPDGSSAQQLTAVGNNEDPSWSPDGRYVMISSTFGKGSVFNLGVVGIDGTPLRQVTYTRAGGFDPAWSPVLPE